MDGHIGLLGCYKGRLIAIESEAWVFGDVIVVCHSHRVPFILHVLEDLKHKVEVCELIDRFHNGPFLEV